MSTFNLQRFRFEGRSPPQTRPRVPVDSDGTTKPRREAVTSVPDTPESERKGWKRQTLKSPLKALHSNSNGEKNNRRPLASQLCKPKNTGQHHSAKGVHYSDSDSDGKDDAPDTTVTANCTAPKPNSVRYKLLKMREMFPQRTDDELLEVIKVTTTLDGAVASALLIFPPDTDSNRKRKPNSQESTSMDSHTKFSQPSSKRMKKSGDSDSGRKGAQSLKDRNQMVSRLQAKFPDLDKEELREVLRQHGWSYENALISIQVFAGDGESDSDDEDIVEREMRVEKKEEKFEEAAVVHKVKPNSVMAERARQKLAMFSRKPMSSASSKNFLSGPILQNGTAKNGSLSRGAAPDKANSKSVKGGSRAKQPIKEACKPKAKLSTIRKMSSSSGSEDDDEKPMTTESDTDYDDVGDEDAVTDNDDCGLSVKKRAKVLEFFCDATTEELILVQGCSHKKADLIVELRPFTSWDDLMRKLTTKKGLSELVWESNTVLKEREVVLRLMAGCSDVAGGLESCVNRLRRKELADDGKQHRMLRQPPILNPACKMKSYQLVGLNWLALLHEQDVNGILADEMGLGKTVQAISFLAHLVERGEKDPHVIVVPSSTLDNWTRELEKWCPDLKVLLYSGSQEERRQLRTDILHKQVDFNVIVSTYQAAITNLDDRSLFRRLPINCAVFDEGHMLKNMASQRYQHLMTINARRRLLLTGTPVQNNLLELMSLLNFVMPRMFSNSTHEIRRMFASSKKHGQQQSKFQKERIHRAKQIMKPFILRRLKIDVLQHLPKKSERMELCPMSERQAPLYTQLVQRFKKTSDGVKRTELRNIMMQLRKMANHPLMHRHMYTDDKIRQMSQLILKEPTHYDADPALVQEDMEVLNDLELHRLCLQYPSLASHSLPCSVVFGSGKLQFLSTLLPALKSNGDRVVMFSQFTMILDILVQFLDYHGYSYVRMDGNTPVSERIGIIDRFNEEPEIFVFLLSTRAGGLGLNLTSANTVILHDPDMNPHNDHQAEDRCHRVGQTRPVQVIRLISAGTVEEAIVQSSKHKLQLQQDITVTNNKSRENELPAELASLLKQMLSQ
ncbi:LOW QUALITY PROTEIN: SWI/SNF-related matrix-associated actin-dependent regulator of chromatin subfamily A containing DEAD/H box 1A-like [Lethenteron reissneri]|uniref:LOW QUALITY PROTEIN: SWI/SNF-related matrix-associated actin-dependent regulator of chromatin subfamily A containing DEAD/H box 1A-like n=1 Tax=Lethenteron reissneri TaxID=7753 RepID=UPI002AB71A4A|nr:LOW QUALITY PROTEIN: SWI/SNF-related matrix-associated actin-dependent regulator of chromatin subfamily A containing DEAD/H box 1A-like [Lethenteron reissneri]